MKASDQSFSEHLIGQSQAKLVYPYIINEQLTRGGKHVSIRFLLQLMTPLHGNRVW